jgi:uncharacterized protein YydD (DUF2326 family)
MKLSKIYSNKDKIFKPIYFNEGFNVIYGKVKRPKETDKDSHNLGKTLLIHLIDFLLLKELKNGHFLYDHEEIFRGFEFYLEILLNSDKYLTIKRCIDNNTKICFKTHDAKFQDFKILGETQWDYSRMSIRKAVDRLNSYLDLNSIAPWPYRKGVSYFLRTQSDYQDVFQISKFSIGEHSEWKPYLAKLLGFDDSLLKEKYDIDKTIESREQYKAEYEKTLTTKSEEYDKLKGAIEIKQREIKEASEKIDQFNFYEKELSINRELVEQVETEVAYLNDQVYNMNYEIEKIQDALETKVNFDLNEIKQIFEETQIHFPDKLAKNYKDLLKFNENLSAERNKRLKERLQVLKQRQDSVCVQLRDLNSKRENLLRILRGEDTFDKFKLLQKSLVQQETDLVRLQSQLETLDSVAVIQKEIDGYEQKRKELVDKINDQIKAGASLYSAIRNDFNRIIKAVLNISALLSIKINTMGNIDFSADIVHDEKTMEATSEGRGTTYKKLLCAAFDLAILKNYAKRSFFRFVYHDGILEGLDNRKKNNFLKLVREYCDSYGLQYILTVITADLPRDENDKVIEFEKEEIVRELNDEGQAGTLFNLPKF